MAPAAMSVEKDAKAVGAFVVESRYSAASDALGSTLKDVTTFQDAPATAVVLPVVRNINQPHGPMYGKIPGLQSWRRTLIFLGLCLGLFLSLMDTSIMATAIYTIALDFNSLAKTFWAILAYQLAYLGFAVVFARLSDFIGRRPAVILAFTIFIGFSMGCGFSKNIDQLIVFRALQGIGGAGLYALALILLIEISTAKLFAFTSTFIGMTIAISGVLGPILGGVLTQYASWRWIFWINGPCGTIAAICFIVGWPNKTPGYDAAARKFSEFDFPGAILLLAASVLVVFGLQEGGAGVYTWSSGVVAGTIAVGVVCWILLLSWEYYVSKRRPDTIASMFPFELLTHRPMAAGIVATLLTGYTFFLAIVSLPLRFQIVNSKSASAAGVLLLPLLCSCAVGSVLGGILNKRKNLIFFTFTAASCLILLGAGLLSTLGPSAEIERKCFGFQVLVGLGVGLTFSSVSIMTSVETSFQTHAVAQGIVAQVRVLGGSIGVAASNAMFNVSCAKNLRGVLTPEQIRDLQTNTRIVVTLNETARQAVQVAYSDAFSHSLRSCIYIAAAGLVVGLFTYQSNPPPIRPADLAVETTAEERDKESQC